MADKYEKNVKQDRQKKINNFRTFSEEVCYNRCVNMYGMI